MGTDEHPLQFADLPQDFLDLYARTQPLTMTSVERMYSLYEAIRYISRQDIDGDVVECGVWRGGSSMLAALTLAALGESRPIWLYDTFEGMPPPTDSDVDVVGRRADDRLAEVPRSPGAANEWAWATLEEVEANMAATGYRNVRTVPGTVEQTIPGQAPDQIALLRLDTDWYESTRHELEHLYPRLTRGGVLIVDDYGHWQGARKAVDEYFEGSVFLHRIDYTGRLVVKP